MYDIVEKWEHLLETDGIITSDVYLADADPIDLIINHPERIAIIPIGCCGKRAGGHKRPSK